MEGALKLKEISYIHAEGYPAAEMKHGAIALIDNEMPTVAIATPDNTYEKTASNIEEIRARGGKIIAVIARDDTPSTRPPRLRAVARRIFWQDILTQRQNRGILSILTQRQNKITLTMEEETHVRKLHLL